MARKANSHSDIVPENRQKRKQIEAKTRILDALRKGNSRSTACRLGLVSRETFYQWLKNPEWAAQVDHAEAEGEAELVELIRDSSGMNWGAAAFLLERRNPGDWAKPKEKLEVENSGDVTIRVIRTANQATDTALGPDEATEGGETV